MFWRGSTVFCWARLIFVDGARLSSHSSRGASAEFLVPIGTGEKFVCSLDNGEAVILQRKSAQDVVVSFKRAKRLVRKLLRLKSRRINKLRGQLARLAAKRRKKLTKQINKLRQEKRDYVVILQDLASCQDGSLIVAGVPTEPTVLASPTISVSPTETASPTASVPPTVTTSPTASVSPTATASPTATIAPTATVSPTAVSCQTAPIGDGTVTLAIPLDSTVSRTDFVSFPQGDTTDRLNYSDTGMNQTPGISGGRARLVLSVSCFGVGIDQIVVRTGGQQYGCGQIVVDKEVTALSNTGSIEVEAVGGACTYVQWVITGTATRVN